MLHIFLECKSCGSENILSRFNKESFEFQHCCMDCYNMGNFDKFEYEVAGDLDVEDEENE